MADLQAAVSQIDIIHELESRGIRGKPTGRNYIFCCPFHAEQHPSFGVCLEGNRRGLYGCLSDKCGARGTFFHLISILDGITFEEAVNKFCGEVTEKEARGMLALMKGKLTLSNEETIRVLSPEVLKKFKKPYGLFVDYLMGPSRKLAFETINDFEILCANHGKWAGRVVLPIYDHHRRLISLVARHIDLKINKGLKVRKLKGTDRSKVLYGLHRIDNRKVLILVEGEFDAVYLQQFGLPAVSLGTTLISKWQVNILKNCVEKVFICLDGDVDSEKINDNREILRDHFITRVIRLPGKKDPNDLSCEEVKKIFEGIINDQERVA